MTPPCGDDEVRSYPRLRTGQHLFKRGGTEAGGLWETFLIAEFWAIIYYRDPQGEVNRQMIKIESNMTSTKDDQMYITGKSFLE